MVDFISTNFPLDETICKHCAFRMSKVITPVDPEAFGLTEEDLEELNLAEDEDIDVEQHTCLISHQDMDYIVKDCNHFKDVDEQSFFIHNPY